MKVPRSKLLSDGHQLEEISKILQNYWRLPFSSTNIPGAILEGVLGHVRKAEVLRTYDFVDVIDRRNRLGWQIKSTLAQTPITWKRAKIPQRNYLISESETSKDGLQRLGDAIIKFCNDHASESLRLYELDEIGYARLIIHSNDHATYFERVLCSREKPLIFNPEDFSWSWSKQKETKKKEQLTALHGTHRATQKKWFAWHGRGENQLHFSGETAWWPTKTDKSGYISFMLPSEADRLSIEKFVDMLAAPENPLPSTS